MSADGPPASGRFAAALDSVRTGDRARRALVTGAALVAGLAAASVHWLGLVLGGAFVGVVQRDLGRAVAAGLAFGALVLVAFVALSPRLDPGELLALTPVVYVTVGAGIGLPVLGSLTRGVV